VRLAEKTLKVNGGVWEKGWAEVVNWGRPRPFLFRKKTNTVDHNRAGPEVLDRRNNGGDSATGGGSCSSRDQNRLQPRDWGGLEGKGEAVVGPENNSDIAPFPARTGETAGERRNERRSASP